MRQLIVNADDCNLTPGVTCGILRAHDRGIVTSTTLLINLPLHDETIRELRRRRELGVGVHLNITLGSPLNHPAKISSLMGSGGRFRRPADYLKKMPSAKHIMQEYEAQIQLFNKRFGKKPDHLDTHHHLHDFPIFFSAISHLARKWKIPLRRSRLFQLEQHTSDTKGLATTNFLFGSLEAHSFWQADSFLGIVQNLPEGVSEIACHPGYCDDKLRKISSLTKAREMELKLFSDRKLRKSVSNLGIELIRFSEI